MAFVGTYEPNEAYTIPDEVRKGIDIDDSHGNMQFKTRFSDMDAVRHIVVPHQSLICKFYHVLTDYITTRPLDDEEELRYYQKPKLLSMDEYGTPELWSWIMYINNCKSIANFTPSKSVKIFTQDIDTAINEILTVYHDDLVDNRNKAYPTNL